jgi:hypothetical protein
MPQISELVNTVIRLPGSPSARLCVNELLYAFPIVDRQIQNLLLVYIRKDLRIGDTTVNLLTGLRLHFSMPRQCNHGVRTHPASARAVNRLHSGPQGALLPFSPSRVL